MRLLQYKDLNIRRVKPAFEKVRAAIEADDFRSADVKKLNSGPYYRMKMMKRMGGMKGMPKF